MLGAAVAQSLLHSKITWTYGSLKVSTNQTPLTGKQQRQYGENKGEGKLDDQVTVTSRKKKLKLN